MQLDRRRSSIEIIADILRITDDISGTLMYTEQIKRQYFPNKGAR